MGGWIENTTTNAVTVGLSAPYPRDVSVEYATSDGSATSPDDYVATSGRVTIPAGSTYATFDVQLLEDALFEDTETFSVRLTNPVNAVLGNASATVTIIDDDENPEPPPPPDPNDPWTTAVDLGNIHAGDSGGLETLQAAGQITAGEEDRFLFYFGPRFPPPFFDPGYKFMAEITLTMNPGEGNLDLYVTRDSGEHAQGSPSTNAGTEAEQAYPADYSTPGKVGYFGYRIRVVGATTTDTNGYTLTVKEVLVS